MPILVTGNNRTYLKMAALGDTVLKMNSKCSLTTRQLRFLVHFCTQGALPSGHLVSPALANFETDSSEL